MSKCVCFYNFILLFFPLNHRDIKYGINLNKCKKYFTLFLHVKEIQKQTNLFFIFFILFLNSFLLNMLHLLNTLFYFIFLYLASIRIIGVKKEVFWRFVTLKDFNNSHYSPDGQIKACSRLANHLRTPRCQRDFAERVDRLWLFSFPCQFSSRQANCWLQLNDYLTFLATPT